MGSVLPMMRTQEERTQNATDVIKRQTKQSVGYSLRQLKLKTKVMDFFSSEVLLGL